VHVTYPLQLAAFGSVNGLVASTPQASSIAALHVVYHIVSQEAGESRWN